jgi:hypothetical protein
MESIYHILTASNHRIIMSYGSIFLGVYKRGEPVDVHYLFFCM